MNYQRTSCCGRNRCSRRQSCFRRSCYVRTSQHSQNGTRRCLRSTDFLRRTPCSLHLDSQRLSLRSLPIVPASCARWADDPTETLPNLFAPPRAQRKNRRASPERSSLPSSDHRLDDSHHSRPHDPDWRQTMSADSTRIQSFPLSFCRQDLAERSAVDSHRIRHVRQFGCYRPCVSNPSNPHRSSRRSNRATPSFQNCRDLPSSRSRHDRCPNSRRSCCRMHCRTTRLVASRH